LDNLTTRREELAQLAGGKSANDAIAFAESLLSNETKLITQTFELKSLMGKGLVNK
jgi:DNA repair protein RecN (Recombination protein N)